jgi:hypothetical protein
MLVFNFQSRNEHKQVILSKIGCACRHQFRFVNHDHLELNYDGNRYTCTQPLTYLTRHFAWFTACPTSSLIDSSLRRWRCIQAKLTKPTNLLLKRISVHLSCASKQSNWCPGTSFYEIYMSIMPQSGMYIIYMKTGQSTKLMLGILENAFGN